MGFFIVLVCIIALQPLGIWNILIPAAATLYAASRGKKASDKASDAQNAATAAAQASDAWKQGKLDDLGKLAQTLLSGGNTGPDGAGGFNVQGALPQAQDWQTRYLSWLTGAPDTTYNAQRTAMERGFNDQTQQVARLMQARGIGNSGMALQEAAKLGGNRAGALSSLAGEREQRKGQMLGAGTALTSDALTRILNMLQGSTGQAVGLTSQVPQLLSQQSANYGNQAASSMGGASDLLAMAVQNALSRPAASSSSGVGSTIGSAISGLTGYAKSASDAYKLLGMS